MNEETMNDEQGGLPEEEPKKEQSEKQEAPKRRSVLDSIRSFLENETVREIIAPSVVTIGGKIAYDKMFGRYERPDYSVTPGIRTYERIADRLPRKRFTFTSDNVECAGYFYQAEHTRGLVAFAHGLHAGADDYLTVFEYFVKQGYSVIAFDTKGTYDSQGKSTVGLAEALVELDHLLDLVKNEPSLSTLPLFVCGHSCGGGAVTSVLSLHPEIRGCTAIAAMKDPNQMIVGKGLVYSAILGLPETPLTAAFLESQQKKLFGDYTSLNGVRGINDTTCPVLLAHGIKDMVIEYLSPIALISHKKELRDDNVFYYTGRGNSGAHDTVWRSPKAVEYQEQVKKELEKLKKSKGKDWTKKDEAAFVAGIDHALYSAVNEDLFEKAVETFEKA
ncbi:MAG: alpha/beta hydrolase [Lachnospiraceae bacterium]|nr:alpha/beta hydrolase [Lachnospiraceae bacterium]